MRPQMRRPRGPSISARRTTLTPAQTSPGIQIVAPSVDGSEPATMFPPTTIVIPSSTRTPTRAPSDLDASQASKRPDLRPASTSRQRRITTPPRVGGLAQPGEPSEHRERSVVPPLRAATRSRPEIRSAVSGPRVQVAVAARCRGCPLGGVARCASDLVCRISHMRWIQVQPSALTVILGRGWRPQPDVAGGNLSSRMRRSVRA